MNILDIILILPLLYGTWRAFQKGFVMALFTVLALLIGLYAAFQFSNQLTLFISNHYYTSIPKYLPAISFILLFLIVGACIYFGGKALEQVLKITKLSFLNKLFGALLGFLKWGYFLGGILFFIEAFDSNEQFLGKELKKNSYIYPLATGLIKYSIPDATNTELYKQIESIQKEVKKL